MGADLEARPDEALAEGREAVRLDSSVGDGT